MTVPVLIYTPCLDRQPFVIVSPGLGNSGVNNMVPVAVGVDVVPGEV